MFLLDAPQKGLKLVLKRGPDIPNSGVYRFSGKSRFQVLFELSIFYNEETVIARPSNRGGQGQCEEDMMNTKKEV